MASISQKILFLVTLCASAPLAAQTCNPHIRTTAPTSRYTVNVGQGLVLDKQTGLMWKRCSEGQSGTNCAIGAVVNFDWGTALSRAAGSTYAGYTDWRLPNTKELESLVEYQCSLPAINLAVFPNATSDVHWSSSPDAFSSYTAWAVNFGYGAYGVGFRFFSLAVRLVRGGQ